MDSKHFACHMDVCRKILFEWQKNKDAINKLTLMIGSRIVWKTTVKSSLLNGLSKAILTVIPSA